MSSDAQTEADRQREAERTLARLQAFHRWVNATEKRNVRRAAEARRELDRLGIVIERAPGKESTNG